MIIPAPRPPEKVKRLVQRVTMEDVARQSGVSLATVSLVLRDKPGINEQTRQRVIAMARTLGYHKRSPNDGPQTTNLHLVGMVNKFRADDDPQSNPFYGPVNSGIELACRRQQINLLYATVPVDADNHPQELPRMLLEDQLDGLLLVGAFVDATIARLMERRTTPTVLVDAYAAGSAYDSVLSDNFGGAYEAVTYLIRRGHHNIGLVGSTPDAYPSVAQRRRGYCQALEDNGIGKQYFADSHLLPREAADAAVELLRRQPQLSALFCCNDATAVAVVQAVQSTGRRVPDDLSIVGFDDIELAEHISPALTTMHVDKISMGRLAVQLLANRAEFPAASTVTAVLRPTLVERQSVRAIDGGAPLR